MKYFSVAQYNKDNGLIKESRLDEIKSISVSEISKPTENSGIRTETVLSVKKSFPNKAAVKLVIEESDWDDNNYIFAPAALYNGNKFISIHKDYPPMLSKEEAKLYSGKTVITDVPRLDPEKSGCAQLEVGDLSVPCFGYFSEKSETGYLMFFEPKNELGNFGITVAENRESKKASFVLSSPCMRIPNKYGMCTTLEKSDDTGAVLKAGSKVTFSYYEYKFHCGSICEFLNKFFELRRNQNLPVSHPNMLPWNRAFNLIEEKYNTRNWENEVGFYKSSEAEGSIYRQWQTGWVGGTMNTLPGLILGNGETKEKSEKTLNFVFDKLQHESGFLYGVFCDGRAYGDNFSDPENINIVMSRKNADALFFLAKQAFLLRDSESKLYPKLHSGLKKLADAFMRFYEKNGDIGQFIDIDKNEPYIGGSASGGLVCAGLALCAELYEYHAYLETAERIAEEHYCNYVSKGYTNGGPGEILSCPDSESAFALLESFVTLYRMTDNKKWLGYAEDTASLCSSWCVAYDYSYKKDTQFYERKIATTGAVWANLQNKHAAPGICTMSGESLLHLYRATGKTEYLELLRDISHNLTQFVSTPENPAYASYVWHNNPAHMQKLTNRMCAKTLFSLSSKSEKMRKALETKYNKIFNPVGRINERVNLSDWEGTNNVGELPLGSCWCEVSAMLTYLEIPAVYIRKDTGFCFALDHIECSVKSKTESGFTLELYNPTKYDSNYRIFIDGGANEALPPYRTLPMKDIFLCSGERKQINISR
ncbi:MAG: hypothetical protein ACI4I3_01800 [Acutalibacteraceae bacterium]